MQPRSFSQGIVLFTLFALLMTGCGVGDSITGIHNTSPPAKPPTATTTATTCGGSRTTCPIYSVCTEAPGPDLIRSIALSFRRDFDAYVAIIKGTCFSRSNRVDISLYPASPGSVTGTLPFTVMTDITGEVGGDFGMGGAFTLAIKYLCVASKDTSTQDISILVVDVNARLANTFKSPVNLFCGGSFNFAPENFAVS